MKAKIGLQPAWNLEVWLTLAPPDTKPHRHWLWGFFTSGSDPKPGSVPLY
ncbi:MAG: hypothetical protein Q8M77_13835 [Hydrogenophaga sp.]|nr:hypothetical protein [Hydrogenophaga sp.]